MTTAASSWGTIYLIRHGEKPGEPDVNAKGVDTEGASDSKSLTPRGWRRAGAWAVFFAGQGRVVPPQRIYASNDQKEKDAERDKEGSHSKRPIQTVTELAARLKLNVNSDFLKGGEQDLVDAIRNLQDVALVCWQHEAIPDIAGKLAGSNAGIPAPWPGNRFDVVWRLTRDTQTSDWEFDQICPQLLSGDSGLEIT